MPTGVHTSAEEQRELRTIVVVTASNDRQAAAVEQELAARRQAGTYGENVVFFAVPDPSSARVGSGGATFNALITIEELVSSSTHWSLDTCRIFMIHSGGDSQRLPVQSVCGKAWSALPTLNGQHELNAPIDLLLQGMFHLFRNVPAGLVVASSDVLLLIPADFPCYWPSDGATGLAIPTEKALGPNHGVYQTADAPINDHPEARFCKPVTKFWQKATVPELAAAGAVRRDDTVLIDSGVVYFSPSVTSRLLDLARTHPLDCCTYLGLDMNRRPLRVELYSDMMMAMGGGMGLSKAEYHAVATSDASAERIRAARDILWDQLLSVPFYACVVEGGSFSHVGTTAEYLSLLTKPSSMQSLYGLLPRAAAWEAGRPISDTHGCAVEPTPEEAAYAASPAGTFTVLNSLFHTSGHKGRGSVAEHCELSGSWHIGDGALASSVRSVAGLTIRSGIAVQELRVNGRKARVLSVLGVNDPIKDAYTKPSAVICGATWPALFEAAGVTPADIWPGTTDPGSMTIWTAKLFPVFPVPPMSGGSGEALLGSGMPPSPALHGHTNTASFGTAGESPVDAVTANRASCWLQWLAPPTAAGDPSLPADELAALRRVHTSPEVLSAWRTARRLSLKDILAEADASLEFAWRRALRGRIDVKLLVGAVSQGGSVGVSALVDRLGRGAIPVSSLAEGVGSAVSDVASAHLRFAGTVDPAAFALEALRGLDHAAATARADIAGRALSVQSALLWAMAGWGSHGHRSGPAHNAAWLPAFALLEGDYSQSGKVEDAIALSNRAEAIRQMGVLRDAWIHRAHLIGRAARHYERAAGYMTAQCIYSAPVSTATPAAAPALGVWVTATCPARVDLAGGWSDTPPVTFEATAATTAAAAAAASSAAPAAAAAATAASAAASAGVLSNIAACATRGGGLVINAAISIDGVHPLGTRVRRIAASGSTSSTAEPRVIIRTRASKAVEEGRATAGEVVRAAAAMAAAHAHASSNATGSGSGAAAAASADAASTSDDDGTAPANVVSTVTLTRLEDLNDYNQPRAEGALVKCALLVLGVIRLPRYDPHGRLLTPAADLATQLAAVAPHGLEIETWSLVPHGSGLGSSSILAATVLAAIAGALGHNYDQPSLSHLVLKLEQMLTTGGGWQDQVGGLWPGVKASSCPATLPVAVHVIPLGAPTTPTPTSTSTAAAAAQASGQLSAFLDKHLFLVYTGKTRLAKNLLQRVLRQWAMRERDIVNLVHDLRATAVEMAAALQSQDAAAVGAALNRYWEQKKRMAPMAEPEDVTHMLSVLQPYVHGASLCGAGGGGFLVGIARSPEDRDALAAALASHAATKDLQVRITACSVDDDGLRVTVG